MMIILVQRNGAYCSKPANRDHQEPCLLLLLLLLLLKCCDVNCVVVPAERNCFRALARAYGPSWGRALALAGM